MQSITLTNIRGLNKTIDLPGPRVLLTGPNGSGKSTVLQSLEFALKGVFGGLSKKDGEIWAAVATADEMGVMLKDGDEDMTRALIRNGSKTSQNGIVAGKARKKAEIPVAIEGTAFDVDLVSLATFWEKSDPKKIAWVSQLCADETVKPSDINKRFPEEFQAKGDDPFSLLTSIEEKIKKEKSTATATQKSSGSTIKSLTDEKNGIERPAGDLNSITTEITALKQTAAQISMNLELAVKNKTKFEAWQEESKRVDEQLADILSRVPDIKTSKIYSWDMERLRNEKAQALTKPNEQLVAFAQSMIDASVKLGCDQKDECKSCPIIMAPKAMVKKCKPKTVDLAKLEKDFHEFKNLCGTAGEYEALLERQSRLVADPRQHLIKDDNVERQDAAESIAKQIEVLQAQEKELIRVKDLDSSIEKIRTDKVKAEELLGKVSDSKKELKVIRRALTAVVFGPISKAVDKHLPANKSFFGFDANDKLLIGWKVRADVVTPRDGLSAGEMAMFDVAMALGIVDLIDDARQKIITIEAAEIDKENLVKFCKSLEKLPDNVKVIAASWVKDAATLEKIKGFEIVDLEY